MEESSPRPGMLRHGVTIMVLFYHLLNAEDSTMRRLIMVLMLFNLRRWIPAAEDSTMRRLIMVLFLIPLIRIISFGLPLANRAQISWYFAASSPLFGGMMLIIQQKSWSREKLGLTLQRFALPLASGREGPSPLAPLPIMGEGDFFLTKIYDFC